MTRDDITVGTLRSAMQKMAKREPLTAAEEIAMAQWLAFATGARAA